MRNCLASMLLLLLFCGDYHIAAEQPGPGHAGASGIIAVRTVPESGIHDELLSDAVSAALFGALLRTERFGSISFGTPEELTPAPGEFVYVLDISSVVVTAGREAGNTIFTADLLLTGYVSGDDGAAEDAVAIETVLKGTGTTVDAAVRQGVVALEGYLGSIVVDLPLPGPESMVFAVYNDYPVIITTADAYRPGDEVVLQDREGKTLGLLEITREIPIREADRAAWQEGDTAAEVRVLYADTAVTSGMPVTARGSVPLELSLSASYLPGMTGWELTGKFPAERLLGSSFSSTNSQFSLLLSAGALYSWNNPYPLASFFTVPPRTLIARTGLGISYAAVPGYRTGRRGWKLFFRSRLSLSAALTGGYLLDLEDGSGNGWYFGNLFNGRISWYISPAWMLHTGLGYESGYVPAAGNDAVLSTLYVTFGVTFRPAE